jgi:hypothetical protein
MYEFPKHGVTSDSQEARPVYGSDKDAAGNDGWSIRLVMSISFPKINRQVVPPSMFSGLWVEEEGRSRPALPRRGLACGVGVDRYPPPARLVVALAAARRRFIEHRRGSEEARLTTTPPSAKAWTIVHTAACN